MIIIEAPRPQYGASRKGNYAYIAPLIPACKARLAGCAPGQTYPHLLFTNQEYLLI
jgi:hypothetical protein